MKYNYPKLADRYEHQPQQISKTYLDSGRLFSRGAQGTMDKNMQYILNLTRSLLVLLVFIGVAGQPNAQEIPRPTEDVILTVTGSISR